MRLIRHSSGDPVPRRVRGRLLAGLILAALFGFAPASLEAIGALPGPGDERSVSSLAIPGPDFLLTGITRIVWEHSPAGLNNTAAVDVCGADLGSMFDWHNRVYIAFGDTFGCPLNQFSQPNWRSNTLAWTVDTTPANGIIFSAWTLGADGKAKENVANDPGPPEETAITTNGVSVGNAGYLFYFEGQIVPQWTCRYSSVAKSTDLGQSWTKLPSLTWSPGSFNQVAIYKKDGFIYFFGIPCARAGGVKLMRVPEASIENKSAYQYFGGFFAGTPAWYTNNEAAAVYIVPPAVGELSVRWNEYLGKYMMMYLHDEPPGFGRGIEVRTAPNLWGPWSDPVFVVTGTTYPCLYGPFMREGYEDTGGKTVYWRMSQQCGFNPYGTSWMKLSFTALRPGDADQNGAAQMSDAMLTAQCTLDLIDCGALSKISADVDCTASLTMNDARLIARRLLELIAGYPC